MKSGVTLQQMLTEVKRQSESKEDYLIAPNRLRMESYGKEMFLHLSDDSQQTMSMFTLILHTIMCLCGKHLKIWPNSHLNMHLLKKLPMKSKMLL